MRYTLVIFFSLISSSLAFSQAREESDDGHKSYYVIVITKDGEVQNIFKEGKGIKGKIGNKSVDGVWYFKDEPDVVTVIGFGGVLLGELKLNEQKNLKLESDQPIKSSKIGIGIGIGLIGVSTGGVGGGPRFMSYKMDKNRAKFGKQKETRAEKIKREYEERKQQEQMQKELTKQAKKDKRKNK
ncbi:MAG: hypothetical protein JKZ03_08100 [Flavobacteriaceae bacterium]|nr:hypothetical protein [Flavobacteriaceae bacterium]PCJ26307.1 MAG: hypothetical protein COA97_05870 [Flavobacteriales bacterium]